MGIQPEDQDSEGWFGKVARSANGLSNDLLSLHNAYETTGDLKSLRSAQTKTGYQDRNGGFLLPSSERHQKLLSKRHEANGTFRSSQKSLEYERDSDLEEEIVEFLRQQCSIHNDGASSSRSVSPSSGSDGHVGGEVASGYKVSWNQSSAPESTEAFAFRKDSKASAYDPYASPALSLPAGSFHRLSDMQDSNALAPLDNQSFFQDYPTDSVRKQIAAALAEREAAHFDTHWTAAQDPQEPTEQNQGSASLTQQAARRLALISSHLVTISSRANSTDIAPASMVREPAFESAYNQLCHGETDHAWDDFQAQGPYCLARNLHEQQQQHVDGCSTPLTQEQQMQQAEVTIAYTPTPIRPSFQPVFHHDSTTLSTTNQTTKTNNDVGENEKDKEPFTFHCPYIGCHKHFQNNYQYQYSSDGTLDGLACVHEGCDDVYVEEAEWRVHVEGAHHGISRTPCLTPRPEDQDDGEVDDRDGEANGKERGENDGREGERKVFEEAWGSAMKGGE